MQPASNGFPGTLAGAEFDKDYTAGKLIGYDIIDFGAGNTGWVALAINGGMLYGSLQLTNSGANGKVVGGSGAYKGVTGGTIVAKGVNAKTTKVTLTYHR